VSASSASQNRTSAPRKKTDDTDRGTDRQNSLLLTLLTSKAETSNFIDLLLRFVTAAARGAPRHDQRSLCGSATFTYYGDIRANQRTPPCMSCSDLVADQNRGCSGACSQESEDEKKHEARKCVADFYVLWRYKSQSEHTTMYVL